MPWRAYPHDLFGECLGTRKSREVELREYRMALCVGRQHSGGDSRQIVWVGGESQHVEHPAYGDTACRRSAVTENASVEPIVARQGFDVRSLGELAVSVHPHDRETHHGFLVVIGDDHFGRRRASLVDGV
jgi:hypothetical protein